MASKGLPFQSWRPFKEAFDPEVVHRAISETPGPVKRLLDPFGGSGTSALTAQFSGVYPTTIEVNPYLADLIESKLFKYDLEALIRDYAVVVEAVEARRTGQPRCLKNLPPTFVEPGVKGKFIFFENTSHQLAELIHAIDRKCTDQRSRSLFRILLATIAIDVSNIVISGKGRRYRKNWHYQNRRNESILELFCQKVISAIKDVSRHGYRPECGYKIYRGDSRRLLHQIDEQDICVFSPPYPNSFDYTDVYNVELWLLGYLTNTESNRSLRNQTLRSHVQTKRAYETNCCESKTLQSTYHELDSRREKLWSRDIPEMAVAYFVDMVGILSGAAKALRRGGRTYCIVGDSKYANIPVPVAQILTELSKKCGLNLLHSEKFRSMRASPQQGGKNELPETLLIFSKT